MIDRPLGGGGERIDVVAIDPDHGGAEGLQSGIERLEVHDVLGSTIHLLAIDVDIDSDIAELMKRQCLDRFPALTFL